MKYYLFILFAFSISCFNLESNLEDALLIKYEKGVELFTKGKYTRAQEQFDYIVMNNPGARIAIDAQHYLAECMFNNKNYVEATTEYVKYIRWSDNLDKIEASRYKICRCAILSSETYQKDQGETLQALSLLQEFIDEYPESIFRDPAEKFVIEIRNKLAKKEYEAGRLYLKLEEYQSAIIYFEGLLYEFYDTDFADRAHVAIILAYFLNDEIEKAKLYLEKNHNNISSEIELKNAYSIINSNNTSMDNFKQLYR